MDKSDIINAIHPLPAGSMERMAACMEEVAYAKGTRILRAGKTERNVFFIKKGIVRAFVSTQGREITFWLGAEGTPVVSMKSYVSGLPGYESVECIEDTVLYVLRHATLTSLFADDVNIANWGRRFAEKEMLRTEERLIPQLFTTAAERYHSLMANHPPRSAGAPGFLPRRNAGEPEPHQGDTEMKRLHRHHAPLPQA